jgi:uncharacterized membrane protein YdjX (TVP38/TMEM64 family)
MQNLTRIVIALLLIVAGSLAWYFDLFDYLSTERLQDAKDTSGIWAPVAFVVTSTFWLLGALCRADLALMGCTAVIFVRGTVRGTVGGNCGVSGGATCVG